MATNNETFGSIANKAEAAEAGASYQEETALVAPASKQVSASPRFRHGLLLACMGGMALSAFIYAMPSKTASMVDSNAPDADASVVDKFSKFDVPAPSPVAQSTSAPTQWQEKGVYCGADIESNREVYDYELKVGDFKYNVTYDGNTCLLEPDDSTYNLMATNVDYYDVQADVTFLMGQASNSELAAIGIRANVNASAPNKDFCQGYEQFLCLPELNRDGEDDSEDLIRLKLQQCALEKGKVAGVVDTFAASDRVSFDYNRWYQASFSASGDDLECKLIDILTGETILEVAAGSSDYYAPIKKSGDVTFGAYGRHYYFADVEISSS